jgi:uncharacterized membrane protein HdeD (DUF308 family)
MSTDVINKTRKAIQNWWLPILLGIGLILLGFWVFRNPEGTLEGLAIFFSIMLLFSGATSILFSLTNRHVLDGWGWNLAGGILELLIAVVLLNKPDIAVLTLNFIVGFWVMFRGIMLFSFSLEMNDRKIKGWGWPLAGGLLTSVLAFCIFIDPLVGAISVAALIGIALILAGLLNIAVGLILRKTKLAIRDLGM